MNDKEKCNCLQQVSERWPEPFNKPIMFDRKTGQMSADRWHVKVYALNKSGTVKSGSSAQLQINYCPICGCELIEPKKTEIKEEYAHN